MQQHCAEYENPTEKEKQTGKRRREEKKKKRTKSFERSAGICLTGKRPP